MSTGASSDAVAGVGPGLVDPISHLQTYIKQVTADCERLTAACATLRTEHDSLTSTHSAEKTALAAEIAELAAKRDATRLQVEEEQKAAEWWRKKEESSSAARRQGGDVSGRVARAAWLADEKSARLEKKIAEMEAEHEVAIQAERSIAAGLRDRIGRIEGRTKVQQEGREAAEEREKGVKKEMEELRESVEREEGRLSGEVQDLRAALREEKRVKGEKEAEIERLTEALRDSMEETRGLKAAAVPSRVLTPLQLNVSRPQTPPHSPRRNLGVKSPSTMPTTPKSQARAYVYLEKRHTELQTQHKTLQAALEKAQAAYTEVLEKHRADREKFLAWKEVEDERSKARKRKREERRRERGESRSEAAEEGGSGKRRKSGEGVDDRSKVLVEASDESAPLRQDEKEAEAKTSQTVQEDQRARGTSAQRAQMDMEEEEEEEQEYYSPEDVFVPAHQPSQREEAMTGISQRLDMATASERPASRSSSRTGRVEVRASPAPAQTRRTSVTASVRPASQASQRGRTETRGSTPTPAARGRSSSVSTATRLGRPVQPARATQSRSASTVRAPATQRRDPSPDKPRSRPAASRRSASPQKTPLAATAHAPARTTPWLGGGYLVRTGSKSNILTTADPFDLSPPEAAESLRGAGPSTSRALARAPSSGYGTSTPGTKPSLVRDRGEASLRKTALTRFPSGMSNSARGHQDTPRPRAASRLGESMVASGSAGGTQSPSLALEGLTKDEKARRLKALNRLSASEKREVYKGYKQEGGRYLGVDEVRRPVTEAYEIDPSKNEGRTHQFHDVKRKKEDRKCMHGGDCEECRDWYEAIGPIPRYNQAPAWGGESKDKDEEDEDMVRAHQNIVSRHRETWVKPPTPPGYWSIAFPTTQDVEAQNRRADVMEREKEERILKDAAASNSKWRKKS